MKDRTNSEIYGRLGYHFSRPELLTEALCHPSYAHENPDVGEHNQRLEFLGDAVLGLVVAEALVKAHPQAREGDLTRWRAALVSEQPLAEAAREFGLGEWILLGRGEDAAQGRQRASLLADAAEAVVGAAFVDGGLDAARKVVDQLLGSRLPSIADNASLDNKSQLQEYLQAKGPAEVEYHVAATRGPEHDKRFEVHIKLGDQVLGIGIGTNKKSAEQHAAHEALVRLREEGQE